jgi:hypothetical protein
MSGKRERRGLEDHLRPDEATIVELDGVVPGYTRWSAVGGVVGILVALTLPRVLEVPFVVGLLVIVGVLLLTFGMVYFGAGRPLGQRARPPMSGPYVSLILTDSRLLLFDRALSAEQPVLVEATDAKQVGAVRYSGAGPLQPQRLSYAIGGAEHRNFEFARSEPVKKFVAAFER